MPKNKALEKQLYFFMSCSIELLSLHQQRVLSPPLISQPLRAKPGLHVFFTAALHEEINESNLNQLKLQCQS